MTISSNNVVSAFECERWVADHLQTVRRATDLAVAPVVVACKTIWPWMTVKTGDELRKAYPHKYRGWVPRGHYPSPVPAPRIIRELSDDGTHVHFQISRYFEGSDRHGSGDYEFDVYFDVPIAMIERADLQELEQYLKQVNAKPAQT